MRASTLATFELVCTVPETTWPPCATGVLSDMERMRGGASGGSEIRLTVTTCGASVAATRGSLRTAFAWPLYGVAVGASVGAAAGAAVALGEGCGT